MIKSFVNAITSRKERLEKEREENLVKASKINQIVVLNGHQDCDESSAIWSVGDGKMARFTIGEVKRKRIELGLEQEEVFE